MTTDTTPSKPAPAATPSASRSVWLIIALLAAAVIWLAWTQHRVQQTTLEKTASAPIPSSAANAEASTAHTLSEFNQRLHALEQLQNTAQEEKQNASADLQELLQKLRQGREDIALFDIEQSLALATQQLHLAGNIPLALVALNTADRQLAELDDARFLPLRKALAADIARLDALPRLDVSGISLRLEQLLRDVDQWPLAAHARPPQTSAQPVADKTTPGSWENLRTHFLRTMHELVRIQRIDGSAPLLVAPEQGVHLREQLKLRLLNARLALLARENEVFKADVAALDTALRQFFSPDDSAVRAAIAYCQQLLQQEISSERPELNNSLDALSRLRHAPQATMAAKAEATTRPPGATP